MITCLNMFQSKNWVSSNTSPAAIILGSPNPYYNEPKIKFGAYAQVYIGTTNSTKKRTLGSIALIPENEKGVYYFMSLATGTNLHDFMWTELPIDYQVISRVKYLDTKEKHP